jgi:hypothetical protein
MKTTTIGLLGVALTAGVAQAQEFYTAGPGLLEGISDNGVGAGSFNFGQYFLWTIDGGLQGIGGAVPGNGIGGQGKISNDGLFVSGTTINGMGLGEISRYDVKAGAWMLLGGLGSSCDNEDSSGWNISGDGQSVVGLGRVAPCDAEAAQWIAGIGTFSLGTIVPDRATRANGVDYDGSVVVGWQDGPTGFRQGAVWVDGAETLIFKADGVSPALEAFDVSGDGQWVTGFDIGGFFAAGAAYRYNTVTDTSEEIPNLEVGAESRMAGAGITDDGATIVGGTWGVGPATFGKAIIWREGIGTVLMSDYLDEVGVAYPAGYNFAFASAISSDGSWICGWGGPGFGASESWIVNIPMAMDVAVDVDIKPGSCPNPINRSSRGVIPISILGTGNLDVADIDVSSVTLSRADGIGGAVAPNEGPPGPHSVYEDTGTPFDGEACGCHDLGGDGVMDLSMKFRTDDVVAALELDDLPAGAELELVVSGTLVDGTPFSGSDCVLLVPPGASNVVMASNAPGVFVTLAPADLNADGDGFAPFDRWYGRGEVVELSAPKVVDGKVLTWRINGELVTGTSSVVVEIEGGTLVEAIYLGKPALRRQGVSASK